MNRENQWCILRTAGPRTLAVVASLQQAGFEVWTPTEHVRRRVPRGKRTEHRIAPLAPTYVFARARHLAELRRIEAMEVSPHPRFSVFRYYGQTVFVPHDALSALRALQQDSYRSSLPASGRNPGKPRAEAFHPGDKVKLRDGAFAGFEAYVETSDGLTTTLTVGIFGRMTGVKVSTLHLRSHNVPAEQIAA